MPKTKLAKVVFYNGKYLASHQAKVLVLGQGFLNTLGLFETMRSYENKIVYFDEHLKRLKSSSKLLGIQFPYTLMQLKNIIRRLVRINNLKDAYVRLTLWKNESGTDTLIIARRYNPCPREKYRKGFSAMVCELRQGEPFLANMKTTNRILYELSFKEAALKGFDEAIILNNLGYVSEAARSNIFLVKDKDIFTPSLSCACLDGITRRVVFALAEKSKIKISEGKFRLKDLYSADECFLTNSLMGVMPLVSVERRMIGKGRLGSLTKFFIASYAKLLKDGT